MLFLDGDWRAMKLKELRECRKALALLEAHPNKSAAQKLELRRLRRREKKLTHEYEDFYENHQPYC